LRWIIFCNGYAARTARYRRPKEVRIPAHDAGQIQLEQCAADGSVRQARRMAQVIRMPAAPLAHRRKHRQSFLGHRCRRSRRPRTFLICCSALDRIDQ